MFQTFSVLEEKRTARNYPHPHHTPSLYNLYLFKFETPSNCTKLFLCFLWYKWIEDAPGHNFIGCTALHQLTPGDLDSFRWSDYTGSLLEITSQIFQKLSTSRGMGQKGSYKSELPAIAQCLLQGLLLRGLLVSLEI